jgi:hypothetical protein
MAMAIVQWAIGHAPGTCVEKGDLRLGTREHALEKNFKHAKDEDPKDKDPWNPPKARGVTGIKGVVFPFTPLHATDHGTAKLYPYKYICCPPRAAHGAVQS